ncbi:Amidase [Sulfidibacter corallicola]
MFTYVTRSCLFCFFITLFGVPVFAQETAEETLPIEMIEKAHQVLGLPFTAEERTLMAEDLAEQRKSLAALRKVSLENEVPPSLFFDPRAIVAPPAQKDAKPAWSDPGPVKRPENLEDLAFASVGTLAKLIETRKVTSLELTELFIARLEKHGPTLKAVVTLTKARAREAARRADAEIAAGKYRGPLHGMPYGAKDLYAVQGYPTTWGAKPYKDQVIDDTAEVVRRLDRAGAVLVAKLSLGALAWGDVWFDGMTRNPWDLEQGSSGSSAGSASAVAAGLVPFALGSETWGSIVSPSDTCGVTGLRPSFGAVSRAGAMALSWSMDKVGPMARTVEDCAIVFETIRGVDPMDPTTRSAPFPYRADLPMNKVTLGYVPAMFEGDGPEKDIDRKTLAHLRNLGVTLKPIELPNLPIREMAIILSAEAAAAFNDLTLSNRDDELVRQIRWAWPNAFRSARTIPAVEYIHANRIRTQVIQQMDRLLKGLDGYVAPSFEGDSLLLTNLTGHPCVVLPNGFAEANKPRSVSFIGQMDGEAKILAIARAYQNKIDAHKRRPPGFDPAKIVKN